MFSNIFQIKLIKLYSIKIVLINYDIYHFQDERFCL